MRLLLGWTFMVAAWVCFVGATYNVAALAATLFFAAAAGVVIWGMPHDRRL
jgi:hypothetical protein